MEQAQVLDAMRESGGLLEGHFELRSGLHSDRYVQCARLLRDPVVAEPLCAALAERMRREWAPGWQADTVVAPALGGLIVGYEMARALRTPFIFAEKTGQGLALRRFAIAKGERFVVAEDVITRGGRVDETIRIVEQHGGVVVGIAVLVDRSGGAARFDYPVCALTRMTPAVYEPSACPLCARGVPLSHPGS